MVRANYRFDDNSYQALAASGVAWAEVLHVLHHAHPRIRHHIGANLRIVAQDRRGRWLIVSLIEEEDDSYLVIGGRYLDEREAEAARKMLEGGIHGQP